MHAAPILGFSCLPKILEVAAEYLAKIGKHWPFPCDGKNLPTWRGKLTNDNSRLSAQFVQHISRLLR